MRSAGPGDDQARFLADLRALRGTAAIEVDELAARAHYPSGILKEAENGPLLPNLPILTAYVRACDGDVPDWEERWRRLTSEIPEDPDLPVRAPGASPAAVAGARAGVGIAPPNVYDPERIKAALRGGRPDQGGPGAGWGASTRAQPATGWSSTPGWDAASDQGIAASSNHATTSWSREPFDIAAKPDPAEAPDQSDQFHWLSENESEAAAQGSGQAGNGRADAWQADAGQAGRGRTDAWRVDAGESGHEQSGAGTAGAWPAAETDAEPASRDRAAQHQEGVLKPAERTDFWATAAAKPKADLQRPPAPPHQAQEQTYSQTSWSEAAQTGAAAAAPAAVTASADPRLRAESTPRARPSTATQPLTPAESLASAGSAASTGYAAAQAAGHEAANHQKDRYFPVKLLIIIVIAALIGSALVLLLR